jgi:hypothetical protein
VDPDIFGLGQKNRGRRRAAEGSLVMLERIVSTLTGGEPITPDDAELTAALADPDFRRTLLVRVSDEFGFSEMLDLEGEEATHFLGSPEGMMDFLQSVGPAIAMMKEMEKGLTPSPNPVASVVDPTPIPTGVSGEELDAVLEGFGRSFYIGSSWGRTVRIEGDLYSLPNAARGKVDIDWTSAETAEGPLEIAEENEFAGSPMFSDGQLSSSFDVTDEIPDSGLVRCEGTLKVTIPIQFESVRFDAADEGATHESGSLSATLDSCVNDVARVAVANFDREHKPAVVARDAAGRRLAQRESQTQSAKDWRADIRFAGTVASVEVFLPVETVTRELTVVATPEPTTKDGSYGPVEVPRYVPPRPPPEYARLTSADLAEDLEIVSRRLSSAFEFNEPAIHAHLPLVANSALARVEFEEVDLVAEDGSTVECEVVGRGYDEAAYCHRISFQNSDGEPVDFARARGQLLVRYPLSLETIRLTSDAPEQGGVRASFDGPSVKIEIEGGSSEDLEWLAGHRRDDTLVLLAYDATGRALRRLPMTSWSDRGISLAFWGTPVAVSIVRPTEVDDIATAFDVVPAPLHDEELQGMEIPCR